jgi:hypothetical protein
MSITFYAGEKLPVDLGEMTEDLFRDAAEELTRLIRKLEAGQVEEAGATPATIAKLKSVFLLVQEERGRFEKRCKQAAGSVGTGTVDLHAARDEIGRRLARLRDAGPG